MKQALLFLSIILLGACTEPKPEGPPNIIFIMTDDHAYQAISAYGSELIQTPNIDKLAANGMLFDKAFVTNSICSPSRAVVLTGQFSHLNGVKDNIDVFNSSKVTFPKILRQNGYETAIVGKWHLKSEPTGFDYWKVLPNQGEYYHPEMRTPHGIVKEQGYVTDVITDLAIGYLDSLRNDEKPFMLMYHHKAPHREWWPSQEDLDVFHDIDFPLPETLHDDYSGKGKAAAEAEMRLFDHMGLTNDNKIRPDIVDSLGFEEHIGWYERNYRNNYMRLSDDEKKAWDAIYGPINNDFAENTPEGEALTEWKYQRYMEDYLATIKSVDDNVGRLLDYLEENDLMENTMIVYTSDQGFYLGEYGWFDKRFMYEPSFRTPLIVSWPGMIEEGTVNSELVQNLDFAPTLLDAAGVTKPEFMQGESLLPILTGEGINVHDALYYHYYEYPGIHMVKRHYGIRTDRYKLIRFYYDVDEWELYDLETDPDEMNNVYDDPEYAEIQDTLHQQLEELREKYGDSDELAEQMKQADLQRNQ